jgi:transketolase
MEFVGIQDQFGQSGSSTELIEHYHLGKDGIMAAVDKVLKRK